MLAGDVIIAVDGTNLSKTGPDAVSKVVDVVKRNPKSDVLFRIERWNQDFDIRVRPRNIPKTFRFAGKGFMELYSNVLDGLKQTFFNFSHTASQVSGPVAIIAVEKWRDQTSTGFTSLQRC